MVSHCFAFCLTQKAGEWWVFLKNGSLISRFSADSDSCMHCMKIIWRLHKMFTEKWRLHNDSCTWHNMHMTYHICRLRKHTPAKVSGSRFKFQLRHWQLRLAEKSAPGKKICRDCKKIHKMNMKNDFLTEFDNILQRFALNCPWIHRILSHEIPIAPRQAMHWMHWMHLHHQSCQRCIKLKPGTSFTTLIASTRTRHHV